MRALSEEAQCCVTHSNTRDRTVLVLHLSDTTEEPPDNTKAYVTTCSMCIFKGPGEVSTSREHADDLVGGDRRRLPSEAQGL